MLLDYYHAMYAPAAKRDDELGGNRYQLARQIADWKSKLPMRFSSLRLLEVSVEGVHGDTIVVNEPLTVNARIDPGKLDPGEFVVELIIGEKDRAHVVKAPECVPLKLKDKADDGILTYSVEYIVHKNGPHCYGVRVLPYNEILASKQETGLIVWG